MQATNISCSHSLILLIQGNLFHGLPSEDPFAHLATYLEICNTVKIMGVPDDVIQLNMFSFSLVGNAKKWLYFCKGHSLTTWDKVVDKFFRKYFSEAKFTKGKTKISSFHQFSNEYLSEAWDRFRGLRWKTPKHVFSEPIQVNMFIDGLRPKTKQLLDASTSWKIKLKTSNEEIELIENSRWWSCYSL